MNKLKLIKVMSQEIRNLKFDSLIQNDRLSEIDNALRKLTNLEFTNAELNELYMARYNLSCKLKRTTIFSKILLENKILNSGLSDSSSIGESILNAAKTTIIQIAKTYNWEYALIKEGTDTLRFGPVQITFEQKYQSILNLRFEICRKSDFKHRKNNSDILHIIKKMKKSINECLNYKFEIHEPDSLELVMTYRFIDENDNQTDNHDTKDQILEKIDQLKEQLKLIDSQKNELDKKSEELVEQIDHLIVARKILTKRFQFVV